MGTRCLVLLWRHTAFSDPRHRLTEGEEVMQALQAWVNTTDILASDLAHLDPQTTGRRATSTVLTPRAGLWSQSKLSKAPHSLAMPLQDPPKELSLPRCNAMELTPSPSQVSFQSRCGGEGGVRNSDPG